MPHCLATWLRGRKLRIRRVHTSICRFIAQLVLHTLQLQQELPIYSLDFAYFCAKQEMVFDFSPLSTESRSKRMKKMLLPLLLILKLKKAVVVKVLFTIIKFISLKALAISFLALILAGKCLVADSNK